MSRLPAYERITEQWDAAMSSSQIAMANTRYRLAADHAAGRDVLEIACGSGFGLDYLRTVARRVVGGDIDAANVAAARRRTGLPVARLDAHALPFTAASFDVVVLYESIYYLRDVPRALAEIRRVLRPGGTLLICLPNRERPGFHPSPYSVAYPSAAELAATLAAAGFDAEILAGFPVGAAGAREKLFLAAATVAVRLRLVPRTLRGRARIKRILQGKLEPFRGIDGAAGVQPLHPVAAGIPVPGFANLYTVARPRP